MSTFSLMRLLFIYLTMLALGSGVLPILQAGEAADGPDRYVTLYEKIFAHSEVPGVKLSTHDKLCLADVAVRLERRTGKAEYLGKAAALFEAAVPDVASKPTDFHTLRIIALLVRPLGQKDLIKPATKSLVQTIALRTWKEFLANPDGSVAGDVDHNIHLAEAHGCAALANFFPDDKSAESQAIRVRLASYWEKIKRTGDLNEDASNYTALGIVHAIELAQALGHEADLQSPSFRRMFERQRDLISTTGVLPEFGDGFFHLDRDAFDFLYLCEYAAKVFDDPTFLTVARRLYDPTSFAKGATDEWCRATALINLELLQRPPAPLPAASVVSYRVNRTAPQPLVDKMILRTGTEVGSAMVMLDLYASGSHAHPAKGPSVAYYEVDGVPLFHNLGRHRTRSAITGNSFWALDGDRAFPGIWKPNEWFTMSIPVEMLNQRPDGLVTIGDRVSLRNFENRGTRQLWFDNLRLEGPHGVKLLDGFESPKSWHRVLTNAPGIKVTTSTEHTEGMASQALNWGVLKAGAYARMLADNHDFAFPPSEFDALKLDVKYEGVRPYLHLRDLCQQIDLGDQALPYTVERARVEQHGHDVLGEVVFNRYVASDAQLTRRLILTAEGYLVICDRWSASASRPRWTAGQLWQFYALKERGQDWFCSEDDGAFQVPDDKGETKAVARRMLVKYATPVGTETFVEQVDQPYLAPNPKKRPQDKFFTTGSRRAVRAGEETTFAQVVVPHALDQDPQAIAVGISLVADAEHTEVKVGPTGSHAPIQIILHRDGRWEIMR